MTSTSPTRNDYLGTAMTSAQVAAAILANLRGDKDAPYVTSHLRNVESALDALHQAINDILDAPAV